MDITSEVKTQEKENSKGATMVEYALLVALIAVIVIAAARFLGSATSATFSNVASQIGGTN